MKKLIFFISLLFIFSISSCNNSPSSDERYNYEKAEHDYEINDGTYQATVDYYNSATGHSATYTLDVEVENSQVTVIYFPNSGYLDDDHITPDELDENGFVSIEGDDGKTYDVQIDK